MSKLSDMLSAALPKARAKVYAPAESGRWNWKVCFLRVPPNEFTGKPEEFVILADKGVEVAPDSKQRSMVSKAGCKETIRFIPNSFSSVTSALQSSAMAAMLIAQQFGGSASEEGHMTVWRVSIKGKQPQFLSIVPFAIQVEEAAPEAQEVHSPPAPKVLMIAAPPEPKPEVPAEAPPPVPFAPGSGEAEAMQARKAAAQAARKAARNARKGA